MGAGTQEDLQCILRSLESEFGPRSRDAVIGYFAKIHPAATGATVEPLPLDGVENADPAPIDANLAFAAGQAIGLFGYRPGPRGSMSMTDIVELLRGGGSVPWVLPSSESGTESETSNPAAAATRRSRDGCLVIVCDSSGCYGYCDYCP